MSEAGNEEHGEHVGTGSEEELAPEGPGRHEGGESADDTGDGGGEGGQPSAGSASGTRQPGADPDDAEEIAKEREERLDPDNRPDNVEVDNSEREFDAERGMFTDSDGYEEAEKRFPPLGEQGDTEGETDGEQTEEQAAAADAPGT